MKGICGANCYECELFKAKKCQGCPEITGCVFEKPCWIAKYISTGGKKNYEIFKNQLIDEFNELNIDGMPKIKKLYPLQGSFVNLEYKLPNKKMIKLLSDDELYLGNQVECIFNDETTKKCFGLVSNMSFLLVCEYEENGKNPEIIIYKKR